MSAHGFKSVFTVGAIAGAALGCYLVSLHVASERAELEAVENRIVLAQRDIRLLETEIGTRGRLAQLERWNVKVIRLSAPSADQFVDGAFQLATLARPERRDTIEAPVVLASAPLASRAAPVRDEDGASPPPSRPVGEMMHVAGYSRPAVAAAGQAQRRAEPSARLEAIKPRVTAPAVARPAATRTAAATKPASATRPASATKIGKAATGDPLGPLPSAAGAAKTSPVTTRESGSN